MHDDYILLEESNGIVRNGNKVDFMRTRCLLGIKYGAYHSVLLITRLCVTVHCMHKITMKSLI